MCATCGGMHVTAPMSCIQETFDEMQTWITELKQLGPQNIVLAIAGNKSDLENDRQVPCMSFQYCTINRWGGCGSVLYFSDCCANKELLFQQFCSSICELRGWIVYT